MKAAKPLISNYDDIIDSRDVIARIEELEGQRDCTCVFVDDTPAGTDNPDDCTHGLDDGERNELDTLRELLSDVESVSGESPHDGAALIRDSYFEDYAMQLAEDIGAIDPDAHWPMCCIDWARAATDLQMDYSSIEYDDVTYWIRNC